jgi:hypothetical protein
MGEPCAADAQCESKTCVLVHNGAHAATLCSRACGLFSPCPPGSSCYDDATNRLCVKGCTDADPACPPGQACLPTYAPERGCLPTN